MASANSGEELTVEEPAISTVATTSSDQASSSSPATASMHPLLLAAACKGDHKELSYLLNREETLAQPEMMPSQDFIDLLAAYGTSGFHRAAADLERGTSVEAPSPASLLEGVTVEGGTALHVVAANGDGDIFLSCADLINGKDRTFLSKQNTKGDTPLHCAVRAGNSQMISHLVALAKSDSILEDLLRKENYRKETVLHEAVRIGDNQIVKDLLEADPELACFPMEGSSPLYLAISLEEETIAETLHEESKDKVLSYLGPNGQNALHAAVIRGPVLTRRLLEWNKDLATKADENGSTPLHFAAGWFSGARPGSASVQLLEANTAALYQPDQRGLFPIHVAASVGTTDIVALFVQRCHRCSRLRDAKGRTFLHVAVANKKWWVVAYACQNASLACILNMQDNDGNTALHLAVKAMCLGMVSDLLGRREVNMNLTNAEGQAPLDIAAHMIPPCWSGCKHPVSDILVLLRYTGGRNGVSRWDHFAESRENIRRSVKTDCESKQAKILSESSQSLLVGTVLVASVTFGAAFAMPGGYRQDDHPYGGTLTLARSGELNAFLVTDTIAFLCSSLATVGFMYSGNSKIDLAKRELYFSRSKFVMHVSIAAMVVAFGLGMQAVLFPLPIPERIGITIVSICSGSFWVVYAILFAQIQLPAVTSVRAIWIRNGPILSLMKVARLYQVLLLFSVGPIIYQYMALEFIRPMESPAHPPAPLP